MPKTAIVTDTDASLPLELAEQHAMHVSALNLL